MSDLTTTQAIVAAITAASLILGGLWQAFTYLHARSDKALETSRALWEELNPFRSETLVVLEAAARAIESEGYEKRDPFDMMHFRWSLSLRGVHGRLGRKGRRRARKISDLLATVLEILNNGPNLPARHLLNAKAISKVVREFKTGINEDLDYFIR